MDFITYVNVGLVMAIVTVIETVKQILKKNGVDPNGNVWLLVTLGSGFPFGFILSAAEGFNVWNALIQGFILSAASSLLYQVGKLSLTALFEKGNPLTEEKKEGEK
jgi:hypothetical protein